MTKYTNDYSGALIIPHSPSFSALLTDQGHIPHIVHRRFQKKQSPPTPTPTLTQRQNSEREMTASVLKQNPNTQKLESNALYQDKKTENSEQNVALLLFLFTLDKHFIVFCPNKQRSFKPSMCVDLMQRQGMQKQRLYCKCACRQIV